ncbi:uncharacterized protein LOC136041854 [Artemia franciscana]
MAGHILNILILLSSYFSRHPWWKNFFYIYTLLGIPLNVLLVGNLTGWFKAQALLSICYLPMTNIDLLIITIGSATWLSIGLAVCCIPYLRLTQPNKYRFNWLAIFCSIIFILATLILTVLALIANPWQTDNEVAGQ